MSISISGSGGITGATTSYSFDQSVSIGGTLTYEDVTNIDSVGIITARQGLDTPTDLVLRTGGTEKLRITSAGITSITGSLEVNGNITTQQINDLNYPTAGALSNRNLVINGAMQVAQRGTSQTATGYGSIDRWYSGLSGATITMSQESFTLGQTDVPGANKYLKSSVTTGNNNCGVFYKVEAQDAFPAINNNVTLSYYAKGVSPTSGLQVGIKWFDGSSASAIVSESVTLTASWVKYTHTFTVPSISGLTMTNAAAYLEVAWQQKNSDTGTAAYEVNLALVQLELGTRATPFEHRSYGDEFARCERYFEVIKGRSECFAGYSYSTTAAQGVIRYRTVKRDTPSTVTLAAAGQGEGQLTFLTSGGTYPSSTGTNAVQLITPEQFRVLGSSYTGLTDDSISFLYITASASSTIASVDAEL